MTQGFAARLVEAVICLRPLNADFRRGMDNQASLRSGWRYPHTPFRACRERHELAWLQWLREERVSDTDSDQSSRLLRAPQGYRNTYSIYTIYLDNNPRTD